MKKTDVLKLFEGSLELAAHRMGLTTRAIELWPDTLKRHQVDRVIAALVRDARADVAQQIAKRYAA